MVSSIAIRQTYRVYAIALVAWAVVTGAWTADLFTMDPTIVAGGWFALGAVGVLTLVGLARNRSDVFHTESRRARLQKFENGPLSGAPLHLYAAALAGWSVVSAGWWLGDPAVLAADTVAYGWFAIALFGAVLTIGLATRHTQALRDATPTVSASGIED